jgi:hypothetical protein
MALFPIIVGSFLALSLLFLTHFLHGKHQFSQPAKEFASNLKKSAPFLLLLLLRLNSGGNYSEQYLLRKRRATTAFQGATGTWFLDQALG